MLTSTCSYSKAPHNLKCHCLQQVRVTSLLPQQGVCAVLPLSRTVSSDRTITDLSPVLTDAMMSSLKAEMLSLSPIYLDHLAQHPAST